ncbi:AraC family transcriptional regulator [Pseudonocardia sp. C8]|uniref:helix-turn-helix transcriptional regulator n=1 Tax=Pseudonocardia sp. C8 TaxID=2762759 RepID=UPI00164301D3|nr:AraC family transcriptional regulator [Pseudonocardia sp. C8]MBC3194481.1 AraC family transcriptional regulator [Pseudonocardia sp. C8]
MPARRSATARDWEQVSKAVANAYFPHELTVPGGRREPRLTLRTLDLGPVLIGYVGWGADVQVECDYPGAYEVNMPLTGHLVSRGRHGVVTSVSGQATVFRADTPTLISHWDATCTVLGVKFDRAWLDREAERVLGPGPVRTSVVLPEQLELGSGALRDWRTLVGGLAAHLREPRLFADQPVVREQLAGAVATGFLLAGCPDAGRGPVARPRSISRVVDAVRDDPARAWRAADMAAVAGTSVRRLQEGFREWMGCSPTEYLVDVRLQHARAELDAGRGASVSEVAARWGFSSASRFAAAYRRRYGCAPSQSRR